MAAVTENRKKTSVTGDIKVMMADIDIAANADTLDTGLDFIEAFSIVNSVDDYISGTKSGGTITFVTDGAEVAVMVIAYGR